MKNFLLLCTGIVLSVTIYAQQKTTSQLPTIKRDTIVYNTNPITVIANRQTTLNLDVPLAVTVVPQEQLRNNRGYGLDEALSLVPGALVQSRTGNHDVRVLIRGFGARGAGQRSNAGTSRGVRFYIDGIPETEPDGRTAFDLIDISGASSIEVVRSNASTLWGNASGGVINISTVPTEDYAFTRIQNTMGSFGYQKQTLQAYSPIQNGKVFATVNNTNFDGWRAHSGSTLFQANAGVQTTISNNTRLGIYLVGASNLFRIPGPLTQAQFDSAATQAQTGSGYDLINRDERRYNRLGRIGTTVEHSINSIHSVSATGFLQSKFLERSERNTFRDFNRYHTGGNVVYRAAFSLSENLRNIFMAGVDEQYQDGAILFYKLTNGQRGDSLRTNKREGANNFGVFAQNEITINNNLSIQLGARYDNISYYNEDYAAGGNRTTKSEDRVYNRVTPKAAINYKVKPGLSIYANLGGGVEVPAGNEVDPANSNGDDKTHLVSTLLNKPITSTTMEVGAKHVIFLDNPGFLKSFQYDVAVYSISSQNDLIPYQSGAFYLQAASTSRKGIEASFIAQLPEGISVMASATFASNTYNNYTLDSLFTKSSFDSNLVGKTASYADNKLPGVPNMFATVRLRYVPTFFTYMFLEAEMRNVGEYFADDANKVTVAFYNIMDVTLGCEYPVLDNLHLRAVVRMNNLTDAKYISSAWLNPDLVSGKPAFIEPGLPRNSSIQLGINYIY
ncbi:MAG: TonB-dependent receptor [Candidatus Kapaibacterium sp.]